MTTRLAENHMTTFTGTTTFCEIPLRKTDARIWVDDEIEADETFVFGSDPSDCTPCLRVYRTGMTDKQVQSLEAKIAHVRSMGVSYFN